MTKKNICEDYIVFDIVTSGRSPWYGDRIISIAALDSKGEVFSFVNDDEILIIDSFLHWVYDKVSYKLVSKSGKSMDLPFLFTRLKCLGSNSSYASTLQKQNHFQLDDITKRRVTLIDFANILNVEYKTLFKNDDIMLFYKSKEPEKIKQIHLNIVKTIEECYLRHNILKKNEFSTETSPKKIRKSKQKARKKN